MSFIRRRLRTQQTVAGVGLGYGVPNVTPDVVDLQISAAFTKAQ